MKNYYNNRNSTNNEPKIYIAAINFQSIFGNVDSKEFNDAVKSRLRKRENELITFAALDKNDSYKAIDTIIEGIAYDLRPKKCHAACVYLTYDSVNLYCGKLPNKLVNEAKVDFIANLCKKFEIPDDKQKSLLDFILKIYQLLKRIVDNVVVGTLIIIDSTFDMPAECAVAATCFYLGVNYTRLDGFPNFGLSQVRFDENDTEDQKNKKMIEKYGRVITSNIMSVIGNCRTYVENNRMNSTQFS